MVDTKSLDKLVRQFGYIPKNLIKEYRCIHKELPGSFVTFCKNYGEDYCKKDCYYAKERKK